MGKSRRRGKAPGAAAADDDLYVRRTGSSEAQDEVFTSQLLDQPWADGSGPADDELQNNFARTDEAKKGRGAPASRQSSFRADANRQAAAPLSGRPVSQPASLLGPPRDSVSTPASPESKPMLALLSAAFPEAACDDLTQSAIQLCDALSPLKHIGLSESETGGEADVEESQYPEGAAVPPGRGSVPPGMDACASAPNSRPVIGVADRCYDASSSPFTAPDGDVPATRQVQNDGLLRDKFVLFGSSTGHTVFRPSSRPASREGLPFGAQNSAEVTADDVLSLHQLNRDIDRGTIRPKSMLRQKSAAMPEAHDSHSSAALTSPAQRDAASLVRNIASSGGPYDLPSRATPEGGQGAGDAWEQSSVTAGGVLDSPSNRARQVRRQGASIGGRGWTKTRTSGAGLGSGGPTMSRPLSQPASTREGLLAVAAGLAGFSDSEGRGSGSSSGPSYDEVSHTHTSGTYGAVALRGSTWMPSKGLHNSTLRRAGMRDSNPDALDDWAWVGDPERSRLLYESPVMTTISYARQDDKQLADLRPATAHQLPHDPTFPARSAAAAEARREQLRQVVAS